MKAKGIKSSKEQHNFTFKCIAKFIFLQAFLYVFLSRLFGTSIYFRKTSRFFLTRRCK